MTLWWPWTVTEVKCHWLSFVTLLLLLILLLFLFFIPKSPKRQVSVALFLIQYPALSLSLSLVPFSFSFRTTTLFFRLICIFFPNRLTFFYLPTFNFLTSLVVLFVLLSFAMSFFIHFIPLIAFVWSNRVSHSTWVSLVFCGDGFPRGYTLIVSHWHDKLWILLSERPNYNRQSSLQGNIEHFFFISFYFFITWISFSFN